jgi:hypothetical protein
MMHTNTSRPPTLVPKLTAAQIKENNDECFGLIQEDMAVVESFCVSAREEAWRSNAHFLKLYLMEARERLKIAIQTYNKLELVNGWEPEGDEPAAPASIERSAA